MTKQEIKVLYNVWCFAEQIYSLYYPKHHFPFPECLQKDIIMIYYDQSLKKDSTKTYDFSERVELKSSTKRGGGCTPFKSTQNNCSRIIYMEIGAQIDVYEISHGDVQIINNIISARSQNKQGVSISLKKYKKNAIKTTINL